MAQNTWPAINPDAPEPTGADALALDERMQAMI
jgi:hypothetical protein